MRFSSFLLVLAVSIQAHASFLRLVPTIRFGNLSAESGKLELAGTVVNQGDEQAFDVKIESVRTGTLVADLGTMNMSENKDVSVSLGLADFGISGPGYYQVPMRVLYRDGNRAGFSAIFILDYVYKKDADSAKASPVLIALDESIRESGRLDISRRGELGFSLRNTSGDKQSITVEVVGSKELNFVPPKQTVELGSQEEKVLQIEVENKQGLPGSSYAGYAIVSGTTGGQVFSEYAGFVVGLVAGYSPNWSTGLLIALIVVFAFFGYAQWRKSVKTGDTDEDA